MLDFGSWLTGYLEDKETLTKEQVEVIKLKCVTAVGYPMYSVGTITSTPNIQLYEVGSNLSGSSST